MKKAEMEEHKSNYYSLITQARNALKNGYYQIAIKCALSSFQYIDGMMQYELKYNERNFASIEGIDVIIKYAPIILDNQSLYDLEALLKNKKRIDKNTSEGIVEKLENAKILLNDAYRMWDHLEKHPDVKQDELRQILGGEQDRWRNIAELWEKMGLVQRTPLGRSYHLEFVTRMGEIISAKCPACGSITRAPKSMLLEELTCPDCKAKSMFVLLSKIVNN